MPRSLLLLGTVYGGMVTIAGVLGTKQVALGPLAVEAGIFPFLVLVALSSAVAELHGRAVAERLVRYGFVPLVLSIGLALLVLALPADPGMYAAARAAFPIVIGQGWRMMAAGLLAYGISVRLNVWLFGRMAGAAGVRGALAAGLSQIVDTAIFITVSFAGVRPIGALLAGQIAAKLVLSAVLVPVVIALATRIARRMDAATG